MKAFALVIVIAFPALASSHGAAPGTADDPATDNTDVWAWQDSATTITILTGWNGLSYAAGGPAYRKWTSKAEGIYEIHIDTDGDGVEDVTYQFQFTDLDNGTATFGRVTSPPSYGRLQSAGDPKQKFSQTYSVSRLAGPRRNPSAIAVLGSALPVAPPNAGPQLTWGRLGGRSLLQTLIGFGSTAMPGNIAAPSGADSYETQIATGAIQSLTSGERVFVGPRADAFFADQGALSDRLKIRTLGAAPPVGASNADMGQYGGGYNTFSGKNIEAIAVQIPISSLGGAFTLSGNQYVGVWSSASRREVRVLAAGGSSGVPARAGPREVDAGKWMQVSRSGNPLVNEMFIPFDQKDAWNADVPSHDAARWSTYFSNPELAVLLNAIYGTSAPTSGRSDLVALLAPDTLKVRVDLGSPLTASSPAFSASLGRTLADDVVDIFLQAAAGTLIGDGVDFFDQTQSSPAAGSGCGIQILGTFPYLGTPYDGQEARDSNGIGNSDFQTPRHP